MRPGRADDIADSLYSLAQDIVGDAEGLLDAGTARNNREQPVIGNGDQRIHHVGEFLHALLGEPHALAALEGEGFGNYGDGERVQFLGERRDHRAAPAPVPPPSPAVTNTMSAPCENFDDAVGIFLGRA